MSILSWHYVPAVVDSRGACRAVGAISSFGAGIYCNRASTPLIANNVITGNSAERGGNIYGYNASPTIKNNTISDNSGKAIHIYSYYSNYGIVVSNNTITGNSGTAVFIYGTDSSSPISAIITDNLITKNQSGGSAGGIFCCTCKATVCGNIISENRGSYANGMNCDSLLSPSVISNNLIVGNVPYNPGISAGIAVVCKGKYSFINNTIAGNSSLGFSNSSAAATIANNIVASNGAGVTLSAAPAVFQNNCVYGNSTQNYYETDLTGTNGNISINPLLDSTYHLTSISPCINAGVNVTGLPSFDIDGEGRIFKGIVDIGADEYWSPEMHIGSVRTAPDGARITGTGSIVTAVFPGFFYIESDNRSCGIRVENAGHTLEAGMRADIEGKLAVAPNGELSIAATSAIENGEGSVAPLGLNNLSIGGGVIGLQEAVWSLQPEQTPAIGLNNIGLLVKVYGKVTQIDPEGSYFYINDGSGLRDGTKTGEIDNIGVRISADGRSYTNQFLTITGISSCYKWTDGKLRRLILVPNPADDIK
ncbi:MAG: right-handed parallel beta-helix repeat-containing protein [Armatimonadota bacterium]